MLPPPPPPPPGGGYFFKPDNVIVINEIPDRPLEMWSCPGALVLGAAAAAFAGTTATETMNCPGELLYNSICLPAEFPPRKPISKVYKEPNYISAPPAVINIDVGRQLFVDAFLLDASKTTGAHTVHHNATYQDQLNPVLAPDKPWEAGWGHCKMGAACPWNASLVSDFPPFPSFLRHFHSIYSDRYSSFPPRASRSTRSTPPRPSRRHSAADSGGTLLPRSIKCGTAAAAPSATRRALTVAIYI